MSEAAAPARDLKHRLRALIAEQGPLSVAAYMTAALHDPRAGYYATKDPIGAGGDFITAPEISQMFGELVGLWCVQAWADMGEPEAFQLVELGPGRGTLMADTARAARLKPASLGAARVHLIEASPALQAVQARVLGATPARIGWADRLEAVPDGPAVVLGNEFLDCLPVRQFVKRDGTWRERRVGLDPDDPDRLAFVLDGGGLPRSREPASGAPLEGQERPASSAGVPLSARDIALIPESLRGAPDGSLVEVRPGVASLMEALAGRFTVHPGRALFIDYGPADSEIGDTLQAVMAHAKVDPLARPGEADITARVDFADLKRAAEARGLDVAGPVGQGDWLSALGLEHRAAALMQARPDKRAEIARQDFRLTDDGQMGRLFKAVAISSPGLPPPAGFA